MRKRDDGVIERHKEEIDVTERYLERLASEPGKSRRELAQGIYRLADVGHAAEIDAPFPCCPQWFRSLSPLWLQREADRLIKIYNLAKSFGHAISPVAYTRREIRALQLISRTVSSLERQLLDEKKKE